MLRSSTIDDMTGVSSGDDVAGRHAVAFAQGDALQARRDRRGDGVALLQPGAAVFLDGLLEAALPDRCDFDLDRPRRKGPGQRGHGRGRRRRSRPMCSS